VIVTLTPNPALDLTYHLDRFDVGVSQRVPPAQMRAGGKGINVARVLHGQGHPVRVIAPTGGVTGASVTADLEAAGLPHTLLPVAATTRTTVAIATPGATTNLNESGHALRPSDWDALVDLVAAALAASPEQGRVLVCSGSMPPDTPADAVARVVETAHRHGALSIVDTSGPQLLGAADAGADVLKPNHHELLAVIGRPDGDIPHAARRLASRSGGVVFASLGPDGMLRVPPVGPVLHARLGRTLSGNTTGAGDAAVAAIAWGLATDAAAEAVLRTATAWSAAAVLHPLAGSLTDPEPLLAEITVTTLEED
jgi:1-phosphofructokinase family hexose kinase